MEKLSSENFAEFDFKGIEACLESLSKKFGETSEEHFAIVVALEAVRYVHGQNAYKFFKEYIDGLSREPTTTEMANFEILAGTYGQQFIKEE